NHDQGRHKASQEVQIELLDEVPTRLGIEVVEGIRPGLLQQRIEERQGQSGESEGGPYAQVNALLDHRAGQLAENQRHKQKRAVVMARDSQRSEEHTSELQSRENLVCRLLL